MQTRSFCYVDDLIDGLIRLMSSADDVTGPINIGNPKEFTMLELASLVIELTGTKSRVVHRPLPQDDPRQRRPDISKAGDSARLGAADPAARRADANHRLFRKDAEGRDHPALRRSGTGLRNPITSEVQNRRQALIKNEAP